jgi:hypothetical protein
MVVHKNQGQKPNLVLAYHYADNREKHKEITYGVEEEIITGRSLAAMVDDTINGDSFSHDETVMLVKHNNNCFVC